MRDDFEDDIDIAKWAILLSVLWFVFWVVVIGFAIILLWRNFA